MGRASRSATTVVGAVVALRPDRPVPSDVWRALAPQEERLLRPSEPHLTVATLGVRPDHRRRGIATRLMGPVLAAAAAIGLPVYLETSSEGNVALHTGIGFETTGRIDVPGGGPSVWGMRRDG